MKKMDGPTEDKKGCIAVTVAIMLISVLLFAAFYAYAYFAFNSANGPHEIKKLSPDIVSAIEENCAITVPEDAKLIKGQTTGWRDPSYVIYFSCRIEPSVLGEEMEALVSYGEMQSRRIAAKRLAFDKLSVTADVPDGEAVQYETYYDKDVGECFEFGFAPDRMSYVSFSLEDSGVLTVKVEWWTM